MKQRENELRQMLAAEGCLDAEEKELRKRLQELDNA